MGIPSSTTWHNMTKANDVDVCPKGEVSLIVMELYDWTQMSLF